MDPTMVLIAFNGIDDSKDIQNRLDHILTEASKYRVSAGNIYAQMGRLMDCYYQHFVTIQHMPPNQTIYSPIISFQTPLNVKSAVGMIVSMQI